MSRAKVEPTPLAIGALGITYQATVFEGKQLAFEMAIDSTVDREALDEELDKFIGAARRQSAIEELPLVRQSVHDNMATLAEMRRQRAETAAKVQAHHSAANAGRRNPRPVVAGSDEANLRQLDQKIEKYQDAIKAARTRIPYLEAVIARREPPEMFPMPDREDAADAA